jgi:hypothetical protein
MTGDALIEQKISVLPPKPDMRVNEYTPFCNGPVMSSLPE